jgi:ankyrin repeat protein
MLKKEIKTLFKHIRNGNFEQVFAAIKVSSELANICSSAPPKKDDGQSPLQVSFKVGNFQIADFLIDNGANVNFIEHSKINEWAAPVLHDCIRAVIYNSYTLSKEETRLEEGIRLLSRVLNEGADVNAVDSYGNSALHRAILDSKQMINHPSSDIENGVLLSQLKRVFRLLIDAGADLTASNATRPSPISFLSIFGLGKFELLNF